MTHPLVDPSDPPERQTEKLSRIVDVLMDRVEQVVNDGGAAYKQFERAVMLEDEVRARTRELERALDLLNASNAQLAMATREAETARATLAGAIETVDEGFGLFDADDRLVLSNSRFGLFMPDIRDRLVPGLSFDGYVDLISRSDHILYGEGETQEDWTRRRKGRHGDEHVVFNQAVAGDRWIQVSEHRTAAGETVVLQTDVTRLVLAERRERARIVEGQSQLMAATLEHLDQGVAVFDAKGTLVAWNGKLGELLALPVRILSAGTGLIDLLDATRHLTAERLTGRRVRDWIELGTGRPPIRFEMTDRGETVLEVRARGMPDGGFVVSFTDVTAERRAERALLTAKETLERRVLERTLELEDAVALAERANASKSRFVAAASHDLLQPLSAARLYISSLPDTAPGDVAGIAAKTQSALDGVETMIEALLTISKLETEEAPVDVRPVALGPVFRQMANEFAPLAGATGLDLRVRRTDVTVLSDRVYLRRVIQNLLSNAIRYTRTGKVLLGARRRGRNLRIEVIDTGPGIPDARLDDIFREFTRIDAHSSASEGLGLGLSIVERACARLEHPLSVTSVVGRGTRFTILVPLARDMVEAS